MKRRGFISLFLGFLAGLPFLRLLKPECEFNTEMVAYETKIAKALECSCSSTKLTPEFLRELNAFITKAWATPPGTAYYIQLPKGKTLRYYQK